MEVRVVTDAFHVPLSQLCMYNEQYPSNISFLSLYSQWVSGTSTDHKQHSTTLKTQTRPSEAASLNHRHHHGPGCQDRPLSSIWPPVAAWPMDDLIFLFLLQRSQIALLLRTCHNPPFSQHKSYASYPGLQGSSQCSSLLANSQTCAHSVLHNVTSSCPQTTRLPPQSLCAP